MSENTIGFRSAFHGFHREDVVHFLDKLNAEHAAEVGQLRDDAKRLEAQLQAAGFENERLQQELAGLREERDTLAAQLEELQNQQLAAQEPSQEQPVPEEEVRAEVPSVEEEIRIASPAVKDATEELEALRARCRELEAELEAVKAQRVAAPQNWSEAELTAYRRAEAVERQAKARSAQLYAQAEALVADLTVKLAADQEALVKASQAVSQGLESLQQAVTNSQETLREGEAALLAVRPTEEI